MYIFHCLFWSLDRFMHHAVFLPSSLHMTDHWSASFCVQHLSLTAFHYLKKSPHYCADQHNHIFPGGPQTLDRECASSVNTDVSCSLVAAEPRSPPGLGGAKWSPPRWTKLVATLGKPKSKLLTFVALWTVIRDLASSSYSAAPCLWGQTEIYEKATKWKSEQREYWRWSVKRKKN